MKSIKNSPRNVGVAGELPGFIMRNQRWWLVPMVISLFLIGSFIILGQSSAIAPFIYTLF